MSRSSCADEMRHWVVFDTLSSMVARLSLLGPASFVPGLGLLEHMLNEVLALFQALLHKSLGNQRYFSWSTPSRCYREPEKNVYLNSLSCHIGRNSLCPHLEQTLPDGKALNRKRLQQDKWSLSLSRLIVLGLTCLSQKYKKIVSLRPVRPCQLTLGPFPLSTLPSCTLLSHKGP